MDPMESREDLDTAPRKKQAAKSRALWGVQGPLSSSPSLLLCAFQSVPAISTFYLLHQESSWSELDSLGPVLDLPGKGLLGPVPVLRGR